MACQKMTGREAEPLCAGDRASGQHDPSRPRWRLAVGLLAAAGLAAGVASSLFFALRSQAALGAAQDTARLRAGPELRHDESPMRRLEDALVGKRGSIICNGTSGLKLTCAPGAICCGAPARQICCTPGSFCAGNEQAPVCQAATTCAGSPIRCSGFSGFICGGEGARCCGSPGNAIVCGEGFECGGETTAPKCVASQIPP